jgi:hypothetical protein
MGYQGDAMSLAYSPDGKTLAAGGSNSTTLLWDVSEALRRLSGARPLAAEALQQRWADLAGNDARKAYDAVWALAATPTQAVPLLGKHLRPIRAIDDKRVARLIEDLGDDEFETRSRASRELEALGELAGPALRKALAAATDVDVQLRLRLLVSRLDSGERNSADLRASRALHVLELAATPAARRLLAELGKGAPAARLTREARAAAGRLGR